MTHLNPPFSPAVLRAYSLALMLVPAGPTPCVPPGTSVVQKEIQSGKTAPPVPVQPLPFSHRVHAETGTECGFCHGMAGSGERAGIPSSDICKTCHPLPGSEKPGDRMLAAYLRENTPIPWRRVYALPSYVFFGHRRHVDSGARCTDCHGPVEQRDELVREKENSMAACVDCHLAQSAPVDCMLCHTSVREKGTAK